MGRTNGRFPRGRRRWYCMRSARIIITAGRRKFRRAVVMMGRLSMLRNDRVRTIYDVLRLPNVRRIELGWGASVIGELAGQVTLVVYAFDAGGAVLVATYAASRTLLSMAVTLAITGVSGRVQPGSLLRPLTWLRAILLALAAL